ncbi:N-formylglutamate amidohydrolase [Legionella worsleiensis]|uniref:N-formylglutamate amidohydrolase n=1 Tax=Legionella worsleiensis TaxID=45076 RepID=A0A0W1AJU7_9GAMM|nr:N-formylglutamate amidohydrolase [Legionella worsleiensis]KTD81627.1 N-formylglutamate amidohydrolase [Legionella worsleiensis]STY31964.1 N-formylglutamate amidohydrolase [Legionella worsleiensis]
MNNIALVISCEHAVDTVPEQYRTLFQPYHELITTHRGIDFGALDIALHLKRVLPADFIQAHTTRLLIDCNRSLKSPSCFSEVTRDLPAAEKQKIIDCYYQPFRDQVIRIINQHIEHHLKVWHLSIHSFTPVLNGQVRTTDIGLLYDPQRPSEKLFCEQLQKEMQRLNPGIRVRRNYPYKGISDGFTAFLRKQFADSDYLGIEIEANQALTQNAQSINTVKKLISDSILKRLC